MENYNHVSEELIENTKSISEVFVGKSILLTGVTGFVGKVLLEKLMRCCPGIKTIYVIIRPSKEDDAETRLAKLFSEEVFRVVQSECKEMVERVKPLSGDITIYDFGLRPTDVEMIMKEVSFVFHSAATIKFEEEMKVSISTNLVGVQNLIDLCAKIDYLEAIVHVSTAYALCHQQEIHEDIYPERMKPEDLISMSRWLRNEQLAELFEEIKNNRPSIYHYTKAIAENLIHKTRKRMPTCIVRPSIVTATWREPFPGWIDSHYGPSGLIAACSQGVLRTVFVYPKVTADFVPVDIVVNTIIASAWNLAINKPETLQVVNCTCDERNLLTWGAMEKIFKELIVMYPSETLLRRPGGSFTSSRWKHVMRMLFDHLIPGALFDLTSILTARKPKMLRFYRKIHKVLSHMEYFTTNEFKFYSERFLELQDLVKKQESEDFSIDMQQISWPEYLTNYVLGVRRYLLKQPSEDIPAARKRLIKIHYAWLGLQGVMLLASFCLITRWNPVACVLSFAQKFVSYHTENRTLQIGNFCINIP